MACLLLMAAVGTLAQHWTVNARAWQYDMTAYAQLRVDGIAVSDYADYEVAAFCGDECRGVAKVLKVAVADEPSALPVFYLRIRSNAAIGDTITFRVYQASTDEETRLEETLAFEAQAVAGTPGEPLMLTLGDVLLGDVNGDGVVDTQDAIKVTQYYLKKNPAGFREEASDVNGDGTVDTQDAIKIIKIYLKKE